MKAASIILATGLACVSMSCSTLRPHRCERFAVLGNSLTRTVPSPNIGWEADWGMAASAEDKDYCHLLLRYFTEANGGAAPEAFFGNVASFEREYPTFDIASLDSLRKCMAMKPDIFILAIGENVPNPETPEMQALFQKKVTEFLTFIKDAGCPTIVVRSTFWPRESIDEPLRLACEAVGGVYVDIRALSKEENYARSERSFQHDGVAIHPGDRGMKAIADAIWAALPQNAHK